MWHSTRIGVTVGVAVGLYMWLHGFFWIRGALMDASGCDSVCGDADGMILWAAMLGAPGVGSIAGYGSGWCIARLLRLFAGQRV